MRLAQLAFQKRKDTVNIVANLSSSLSVTAVRRRSRTSTMSFARRLVVEQVRARLLLRPSSRLSPSALLQRHLLQRNLSSTPRLLAQPANSHAHHEHSHSSSIASDNYINPYKNGPSAIDKAVHLFFFTEILRGMLNCLVYSHLSLQHILSRNVDCSRAILPPSVHYHVPF